MKFVSDENWNHFFFVLSFIKINVLNYCINGKIQLLDHQVNFSLVFWTLITKTSRDFNLEAVPLSFIVFAVFDYVCIVINFIVFRTKSVEPILFNGIYVCYVISREVFVFTRTHNMLDKCLFTFNNRMSSYLKV